MVGRVGAGALGGAEQPRKSKNSPPQPYFLSDLLGVERDQWWFEWGGGHCGSSWQMRNFITEPHMNAAPPTPMLHIMLQ